MTSWEIHTADILDWAAGYDGPKFHALLSDPPYELKFMSRAWDASGISFQPETWAALAQHLHPGAFGMAFASSRGWHRLAVAIEDAGMIIQPSIFGWATGQSFPKATRIDTAIDRRAGKLGEREVIGSKLGKPGYSIADNGRTNQIYSDLHNPEGECAITAPATPLARAWAGHRYGGQILKNSLEPIIVFQKPWQGKRLDCIVETGAGSMWVDGSRVGVGQQWWERGNAPDDEITAMMKDTKGRWPSNFTLTHSPRCQRVGTRRVKSRKNEMPELDEGRMDKSQWRFRPTPATSRGHADPDGYETVIAWDCVPECVVRRLGEMSGESVSRSTVGVKRYGRSGGIMGKVGALRDGRPEGHNDTGTAARFYFQADWSYEIAEQLATADPVMYCAKASRKERDAGLEELPLKEAPKFDGGDFVNPQWGSDSKKTKRRNVHPTVKPIALTRWLATLLLPPQEYAPRRLLIPFSGSGSEGIGAGLAGWEEMVLIDLLAENNEIAEARLQHWLNRRQLELNL